MFEDIDIKAIKKELRNFSKNYIENFNKIEKFVKSEIDEILTLKKKNTSIIPEISFNQIDQENIQEISNIPNRAWDLPLQYIVTEKEFICVEQK